MSDEWQRLPGLFYEWEFERAYHEHGDEFRFEHAGYNSIGVALFAIYAWMPRTAAKESE